MEFQYKAVDKSGKVVSGDIEAPTRIDVINKLKQDGMTLLDLSQSSILPEKKKHKKTTGKISFSLELGVSEKMITFFTRQFASTLRAGLPILRCLTLLKEQSTSKRLKEILEKIMTSIQQGKGLYQSFKEFSPPFSLTYLSMIKVGEASGNLADVMAKLADSLERQQELRGKFKSAMSYPLFILCFALVMVYVMVAFLLPTFTPIFKNSGLNIQRDYPVTYFLVNVSDFVQHKWFLPLVIGIFALIFFIFKVVTGSKKGKQAIDKTVFYFPFLQGFIQMSLFSQFADSMGTLLASGVNLIDGLKLTSDAIGNVVLQDALNKAIDDIQKGIGLSKSLAKTEVFPQMMIQMLSIGEEAGNLDEMFSRVSTYYKQELESSLNSLASIVEPAMIIFVGIAVFFFVFGIFMPIMGISQAYQVQINKN